MNLDDKKFLAEWMGWLDTKKLAECQEYKKKGGAGFWIALMAEKSILDKALSKNPDTNPEQFKKVWNKASLGLKEAVCRKLDIDKKFEYVEIGLAELIINDLPKVMNAFIEVIKKLQIK